MSTKIQYVKQEKSVVLVWGSRWEEAISLSQKVRILL